MSHHSTEQLNAIFNALANGTRRKILTRLVKEPRLPVSELSAPFEMSLAAVSKHIRTLEKAGLIVRQKEGATHYCSVNLEAIRSAAALVKYFEQFLPH